jgi:hypothetical protein
MKRLISALVITAVITASAGASDSTGFTVIIGCGEPEKVIAAAGAGNTVVQALDRDPGKFDGMIAAAGRLFLANKDGSLVSYK